MSDPQPAPRSNETSFLRRLVVATQPALTRIAHGSAPFITVFALIHLTAPVMANLGGASLASQTMVSSIHAASLRAQSQRSTVAWQRVLPDVLRRKVPHHRAARPPWIRILAAPARYVHDSFVLTRFVLSHGDYYVGQAVVHAFLRKRVAHCESLTAARCAARA